MKSVPEINMPPAFLMSPERFISSKSLTVIVSWFVMVLPPSVDWMVPRLLMWGRGC
jgi:hypothetical protein